MEDGILANAEVLRHVACQPRAQVAGARADKQGVQLLHLDAGLLEGGREGASRESGGLVPEVLVQFVRRPVEDPLDLWNRKVALPDAMVAAKDIMQDQHRAFLQARTDPRFFHDAPAIGLSEAGRWNLGGESVQKHREGC